jgi:hypothetical protein
MADNQDVLMLAARVRTKLAARHIAEKLMLGGITFLVTETCCVARRSKD